MRFSSYEEHQFDENNNENKHLIDIGNAAYVSHNLSHHIPHIAHVHATAHNTSTSQPNHLQSAGHAAHVAHTATHHLTLDHFKNLRDNNSEVAPIAHSLPTQPLSNASETIEEHLKSAAEGAHSMAMHAHHVGHHNSKSEDANETETVTKIFRSSFTTFGKCVENCTQNSGKTT